MKPISATAVSRARGCLRKQAFAQVLDKDQKISARSGSRLHGIQEAYLRHGTPPPDDCFGELATQGLPFMPPPGSVYVEQQFEIVVDGIPFAGVIDMLGTASVFPGLDAPPSLWCVADHKTSKNPKRYGIWTKAQRLDDPQTLIYDTAVVGVAEAVANRWLYYPKTQDVLHWELQTYREEGGTDVQLIDRMARAIVAAPRKPKVKPSDGVLTRREIRGGMERIVLPTAEKIIRLRERNANPLDVEPNTGHCDDFGGCEYRGTHCNPTIAEHAAGLFPGATGGSSMAGLWDKLQVNGATEAPPVVTTTAPPVAQAGFAFSFGTPAANPAAVVPAPASAAVAAAPVVAAPTPPPLPFPAPAAPTPAPVQSVEGVPPLALAQRENAREILACVGRALIAAGRVLGGE